MRLKSALVAPLLLFVTSLCVYMTSTAATPQDDGGMMAKDEDPGWEAVTVKPADQAARSSQISINGRHILISNEPVEAMLKFAYSVQSSSQVVDAPQWMKTERWDVSGVPDQPGKPNLPQFQSMTRKLLEQRFGLKLHREKREMPVFALTLAKGGPKMQKSENQNLGPGNNGGPGANGVEDHRYTNTAMPDLALMLMIYTERQIIDQTGLQGRFNFELRWSRDEAAAATPDAPPGLFTAIQEQIGLKLEPEKAQADVLVIDKAERPGVN